MRKPAPDPRTAPLIPIGALAVCAFLAGPAVGLSAGDAPEAALVFPVPQLLCGQAVMDGALGDVDGDGSLDLLCVAGDATSGSLLLARGHGNGWLGPVGETDVISDPSHIDLGALDQGAPLDVVIASEARLVIGLGLGDGSFAFGLPEALPLPPVVLALGDVTGDATTDLVLVDTSGTIHVRAGQGDGSFVEQAQLAAPPNASAIELADLDGNQVTDILVVSSTRTLIAIHLAQGGSLFSTASFDGLGFGRTVRAGDVNGDRIPDLVVGSTSGGTSARYLGLGNGGFTSPVNIQAPSTVSDLWLVDHDADGDTDVLAGSSLGLYLLDNIGFNGIFMSSVQSQWTSDELLSGDLDHDGLDDLLTLSHDAGLATVLLRTPGGSALDDLGSTPGKRPTAVGDVDGDGRPDLLSMTTEGQLQRALGLGDGGFGPPALQPFDVGSTSAHEMLPLDADGNELLDIAIVYDASGDDHVGVLVGDGEGGLVVTHTITISKPIDAVTLGHFDLGSSTDVAIIAPGPTTGSPPTLFIALGDGDGTFAPPTMVSSPGYAVALAAGDLDGDGLDDLVSAHVFPDSFVVRLASGGGAFGPPTSFPLPETDYYGLALGNLDGDGAPDLVVIGEQTIRVFHGDGAGGFSAGASRNVSAPLNDVKLADLDLDGDLDIVLSTLEAVHVAFNPGDGSLDALVGYAGSYVNLLVHVADVDGSGTPDLLATCNQNYNTPLTRVHRSLLGSAWHDLGGGTNGSAGPPRLAGSGPLFAGSSASLALTHAPPNAFVLAWLSFAPTPVNIFGGVLHAWPFHNQLVFLANDAGEFSISTPWPAGVPPGTEVWFQFLLADASVIWGITMTNGVRATSP